MWSDGIDGRGLSEIASHAHGNDPVYFQDEEGKLHRIRTAIKTRTEIGDYYGSVTILRESMADEFIMRVYPPTQELQQRIDEYNKTLEK